MVWIILNVSSSPSIDTSNVLTVRQGLHRLNRHFLFCWLPRGDLDLGAQLSCR